MGWRPSFLLDLIQRKQLQKTTCSEEEAGPCSPTMIPFRACEVSEGEEGPKRRLKRVHSAKLLHTDFWSAAASPARVESAAVKARRARSCDTLSSMDGAKTHALFGSKRRRCGLCSGSTNDVIALELAPTQPERGGDVETSADMCDTSAAALEARAASSRDDSASARAPRTLRRRSSEFVAIAVLGQGSFGKVHLVRDSCGSEYALKSVALAALTTSKKAEHARSERRVLQLLCGHPNIVRLRGAWRCERALHALMDVAWGGELFRHLQRKKRFLPLEARFVAAELSAALLHAHSKGVVYRDVKPENVLFDVRGHVLLADFGLSKIVAASEGDAKRRATRGCLSLCGTPEYMAPEILERVAYGSAVDWWALGMLLAELVTGLPPWYVDDRAELFRRVRHEPLERRHVFYSGDLLEDEPWAGRTAHFVCQLLEKDPRRRPTDGRIPGDPFFEGLNPLGDLQQMEPPFNPMRDRTNRHKMTRELCDNDAALRQNFDVAKRVSLCVQDISFALKDAGSDPDAPPPPPPGHPDDDDQAFRRALANRKPKPGNDFTATRDHFPSWDFQQQDQQDQ